MVKEHVVSSPLTLLPHGLFADQHQLPFGLNNVAMMYFALIRPSANTHVE